MGSMVAHQGTQISAHGRTPLLCVYEYVFIVNLRIKSAFFSVADQERFEANPDPILYVDTDPDPRWMRG